MIPKFRAWDENGKRYEGNEVCLIGELVIKSGYSATRWEEEAKLFNLCQSTGLKDKNGVEIYEGDVTKLGEGGAYHICVVEFNNDELCYQLTNRKTIGEYIGELLFVRGKHMAECEVIGSIYKNPELLEVTGK